jgi:hypothetical protein
MFSFSVINRDGEIYTLTADFFIRYPGSSTILRFVKKVCSIGSFLDKKYIRQNAVLTEEMLDETGARLEHSPRKSLARSAQQAQISRTTGCKVTKNLYLQQFK